MLVVAVVVVLILVVVVYDGGCYFRGRFYALEAGHPS